MRSLLSTLVVLWMMVPRLPADIIRRWDFNSPAGAEDFQPTTGTVSPSLGGGGPARTIGGLTNRFGSVAGGATSDPNTLDNSQWRVGGDATSPAPGTRNKETGVEFPASTAGFRNIRVSWDQQNSATASRYWRWQYTVDGTHWIDHTVVTAAHAGPDANGLGTPLWQVGLATDLSQVAGVADNPSFALRLVSEFESTATGAGQAGYVANRPENNYGMAGTLWLDMVTVTGDPLDPANQPPQVTGLTDLAWLVGDAPPAVAFTVNDAETPAESLVLDARAEDSTLVQSIALGGMGRQRSLIISPVPGRTGSTPVIVRATDAAGRTTEASFLVRILAPLIEGDRDLETAAGVAVSGTLRVLHLPGDPAGWSITVSSDPEALLPAAGITIAGEASERQLTVNPAPGATGLGTVTVRLTSGTREASTTVRVRVLPGVVLAYDLSAVPNEVVATVAATTVTPGLAAGPLERGPGPFPFNLTSGFSASGWNRTNASRETALARGDYYQFSFTVSPGHQVSLAGLTTSLRLSAISSPMNCEWQYSLDGFQSAGTTIPPRGPVWTSLGWSENHFTFLSRNSGTAPASFPPHAYLVQDVAGQGAGNAVPTIDLSALPGLQKLAPGTKVTFRLYAWGTDATVESNTLALGRNSGPTLRGTVVALPAESPVLAVVLLPNGRFRVTWPPEIPAGTLLQVSSPVAPFEWLPATGEPFNAEGRRGLELEPTSTAQLFRLSR